MTLPEDGLAGRLAGYAVVSCDIFDTALMRRLARPEDLLLATGLRLRAAGLASCDPAAFVPLRRAAEQAVRAAAAVAGSDEPSLESVYAWLRDCGVVTDAVAAAMCEFAAEQAACVAVPEIQTALAALQATQRTVFVSDSMLPGAWLARLLEGCGFGADCTVFSSADLGRSKHTGRLFPAVLAALGVPASSVVHVGDNPVSDVARARAAGLAAVHLPWTPPPPADDADLDPLARLARSRRRARAGAGEPDPAGLPLARHFALLLLGFSLFVLAEAKRRGVRRIYFLARDGHIPLALVRRLAARRKLDLELVYLEVSRQSVVVPTLAGDLDRLARDAADAAQGRPLAQSLGCIGLDAAATAALARAAGLDPVSPVRGHDAVRALVAASPDAVGARVDAMREAALGYLTQSGFAAAGPRLVVDVGWRGSIQSGLAALTGAAGGEIGGCYLGLWPEALRPGFGPADARGYLFGFGHPQPLADAVREGYILLELVLSAPHGTVLGYAPGPDGLAPIRAAEAEPGASARHRAVAALEAGCLAEFDALDALIGGAWPDGIDPASAFADAAGLLTRPSAAEVAAVNAIPFIHGVDGRRMTVAVNPVPWHEFLRRPRASLLRLERAPWRAGAVRASLPAPLPSMDFRTLRDRAERLLRRLRWPA